MTMYDRVDVLLPLQIEPTKRLKMPSYSHHLISMQYIQF